MTAQSAFYIMTFTPLWSSVVEDLKMKHHIEPALYTGLKPAAESSLDSVPFYDVNDARMAIRPSCISGFTPAVLDPEILGYYAERQAVIMEMISRFSLGKKAGSFAQRRHYLWEMIRIWEGLFAQFKPSVVIAGSMPHRVFDYVIYLICERQNIPFVALEATSVPHLFYACTSIHDQSGIFAASRFKIQPDQPLMKETQEFFDYVRKAEEGYKPYNLSLSGLFSSYKAKNDPAKERKARFKKLPQLLQIMIALARMLVKGTYNTEVRTRFAFTPEGVFSPAPARPVREIDNLLQTLKASIAVGLAEKWYKRNTSTYDAQKPYVYFPANFMPERSTVPDSGYFFDYTLIFSMLERAIPADWQILYKEHPRSFHKPIAADNPRDVDFFLKLKVACPRLIFLDQQEDSKALIRNAALVATASGTSGWEALARGKPAFLFGERWYGSCEGVYPIYSLDELNQAVASIQKTPIVPESNVIDFLKRVESVSENMAYYYKDNIEERAHLSDGYARAFSEEERAYREHFITRMSSFLNDNIQKFKAVS
jgi:hypothetical protein